MPRIFRLALLVSALGLVGACHRQLIHERMESEYPPDRAAAAIETAERGDVESVPRLVRLLEDADPAVRLYAIQALERLCGQTYGYVYYASEASRTAAAARWKDALRSGQVTARPRGSTSPAAPAGSGPATRASVDLASGGGS